MMRKLWNSMQCFSHLAPRSSTCYGITQPFSLRTLCNPCEIPLKEENSHIEQDFHSVPEGEVPLKPSLSLLLKGPLLSYPRSNNSVKRFLDTLGYLDWFNSVLPSLNSAAKKYYPDIIEGLGILRKCLVNIEKTNEEDSTELGNANFDLAEAYVAVLDFEKALPFGLKALEIHKKQLGDNAVLVARDMKLLGIVYSGLGKHDKALEHNVLVRRIFKSCNLNLDLLLAEIDAANIMIAMGTHDEAVGTLKNVIEQMDKESVGRVLVLISMAKALFNQERIAHCRVCLEISLRILDKRERISPVEVAEAYTEISMLYETMHEIEIAISLLKKALVLLERHSREQHSQGKVSVRIGWISSRIGWLLALTGKVQSAVFHLEGAAERLKDNLGVNHVGLCCVYNNLGVVYGELGRAHLAVQLFKYAWGTKCGSGNGCAIHEDAIEACQNLAKASAKMGNYGSAIEYQEQVINLWKSHRESAEDKLTKAAEDKLREASGLLWQLKKIE